jgi:hypothetical protein
MIGKNGHFSFKIGWSLLNCFLHYSYNSHVAINCGSWQTNQCCQVANFYAAKKLKTGPKNKC